MMLGRASFVLGALVSSVAGLLTAPGSPCEKYCGNVLSSTTGAEMTCFDNPADYSTSSQGNVFQNCLTCEARSPYYNGGQSDLQYLLYNMRYTISYCMWDFPDNDKAMSSSPCKTATACEKLKDAIQWQNLSTTVGQYDFCRSWNQPQVAKCTACLKPGTHYILANFHVMLDAACSQLPPLGSTISVSGLPFTTDLIAVTDPTPTGYAFTPETGLTLGAKVGIAGAGVVLLLAVAGCGIICNGKRRRRAYLRDLEKRHAAAQAGGLRGGGGMRWPGNPGGVGGAGGADMFETPVSQRPLFGGWEASPISAHTDNTGLSTGLSPAVEQGLGGAGPSSFTGRYFSPYNSQYNSPVSAQEAHAQMQWPAAAAGGGGGGGGFTHNPLPFDKLAALEREQQFRAAAAAGLAPPPHHPYEIGLAFGGDDPSLRSKKSEQSLQSIPTPQQDQKQGSLFPELPQQQQQPYYLKDGEQIYLPPPPPHPPPSHIQSWVADVKGKSRDFSPSSQQQQQQDDYGWTGVDVKGKRHLDDSDGAGAEEFELHEVDSNGSLRVPVAAPNQAPVLSHPGYGRYPPPPDMTANRQQWV